MRRLAALVLVFIVVLANCGDDDADDNATTTTSTALAPARDALHLGQGGSVDLNNGWTLAPCEAGPPIFCFRKHGETRGILELLDYPADEYEVVSNVLQAGGTESEALAAQAGRFHEVFQKDRSEGCGPEYAVAPFGPEEATVAGHAGVSYGFDGFVDDELVERALQFAVIENEKLYILATTAVKPGTCLDDTELDELSIEDLAQIELELREAIAEASLPST